MDPCAVEKMKREKGVGACSSPLIEREGGGAGTERGGRAGAAPLKEVGGGGGVTVRVGGRGVALRKGGLGNNWLWRNRNRERRREGD